MIRHTMRRNKGTIVVILVISQRHAIRESRLNAITSSSRKPNVVATVGIESSPLFEELGRGITGSGSTNARK